MKKLLTLVLVMFLFCSSAFAEGLTVTDGMGREVYFDTLPETCASITPANTEILFALGLSARILGVDNQSDYPAEAIALETKLGDYFTPNIEAIVALKPDVVFASTQLQKDSIAQLESLGVKVVCNDPTDFAGIVPGIELLATVMSADAAPITEEILKAVDEVKAQQAASGKKVFFALSFGEYGNYTAGPGTFIDDIIKLCGGVNVAGDMPVAWPEYSMEKLTMDDPDLIVVSDYVGDGAVVQQLSQTQGFDHLRATGEGQVYPIDANVSSRPGPRIGEALRLISECMAKASAFTELEEAA